MDHDGDVPVDAAASGNAITASLARREVAIVRRQRGEPATHIAAALGVSVSSVQRWWRRWQTEGTVRRRPGSGRRPWITEPLAIELQTLLASRPTTTLADLCAWLAETHRIVVSVPTMSRTLRRLGWHYQTLTHR